MDPVTLGKASESSVGLLHFDSGQNVLLNRADAPQEAAVLRQDQTGKHLAEALN
jgi:hypothetical protein